MVYLVSSMKGKWRAIKMDPSSHRLNIYLCDHKIEAGEAINQSKSKGKPPNLKTQERGIHIVVIK